MYNYEEETMGIERSVHDSLSHLDYRPADNLRGKAERRLGKAVANGLSDKEIADFLASN